MRKSLSITMLVLLVLWSSLTACNETPDSSGPSLTPIGPSPTPVTEPIPIARPPTPPVTWPAEPGDDSGTSLTGPQFFVTVITATAPLTQTPGSTAQVFVISRRQPLSGLFPVLLDEPDYNGVIRLALARPYTTSEPLPLHLLPPDTNWLLFVPDDQGPFVAMFWQEIAMQTTMNGNNQWSTASRIIQEVIPFPNDPSSPENGIIALDQAISTWQTAHPGQQLWVDFIVAGQPQSTLRPDWTLYGFVSLTGGSGDQQERYCCYMMGCGYTNSWYRRNGWCSFWGCTNVCQQ